MSKLTLNLELLAIPLAMSYTEIPTGISAADEEPVRYVASAKAEYNPRRGSGLL